MKERQALYRFSFVNNWFIVKLVVLVSLWSALINSWLQVKDLEPLKGFVPNEILGVDAKAPIAEIRKAYRKLSRTMHPDKNPDNPKAVNEFIQITKAYTIMTDESARENFAKYGNPDGPGNFQVGIALPKTLQDKDQQIFVLVLFFTLLVFVIPGYFYSELFKEARDIGGVSTENRKIFYEMLDNNIIGRKIPGMLGQGEEFVKMKVRSQNEL
jgi:translocation protein SEC63